MQCLRRSRPLRRQLGQYFKPSQCTMSEPNLWRKHVDNIITLLGARLLLESCSWLLPILRPDLSSQPWILLLQLGGH